MAPLSFPLVSAFLKFVRAPSYQLANLPTNETVRTYIWLGLEFSHYPPPFVYPLRISTYGVLRTNTWSATASQIVKEQPGVARAGPLSCVAVTLLQAALYIEAHRLVGLALKLFQFGKQ